MLSSTAHVDFSIQMNNLKKRVEDYVPNIRFAESCSDAPNVSFVTKMIVLWNP